MSWNTSHMHTLPDLGYVSRSMMTRLILATHPWSTVAITLVVSCAMPTAMASPLVVISTTCVWLRPTSKIDQLSTFGD